MKVISPLDGGGQEVILTLIQGGCNFILRPTLLILEPPPPDNYCTVPKRVNFCGEKKYNKAFRGVYFREQARKLKIKCRLRPQI